jgi:hypothetical protein
MIDEDKKKSMVDNYKTCAGFVDQNLNFNNIGSQDGR